MILKFKIISNSIYFLLKNFPDQNCWISRDFIVNYITDFANDYISKCLIFFSFSIIIHMLNYKYIHFMKYKQMEKK